MDLKDELARQSLLLQFIAECAGIESIPSLLDSLGSHLRWIADHDAVAVLLPDDTGSKIWAMQGGEQFEAVGDGELAPGPRAAFDRAMASGTSSVSRLDEQGTWGFALPLGTTDRTLGVLLVQRHAASFSQSDVRHLHHGVRAVGAALARIVGAQTERRAQRAVEEAEARLRALAEDRALLAEQMIGIVSHDLRNPLAAVVMGAAVLAAGQELPPQKARVLQSVTNAGHRARRLIDDLLDFTVTRLGQGLEVTRKPLDLHELAARSVDELSLTFEGHAILHRADGPGEVDADADRIEQAIGNLVANAVKYGDARSPILVTSSIHDGMATLAVHNEGAPIPEAIRSTLFEPMVRGTETNSRARSVGLGLFIVRAIAEAHGGSVEADSSAEDGTTFTLRFPAASASASGAG
jgi:signal transduction histidine kinase